MCYAIYKLQAWELLNQGMCYSVHTTDVSKLRPYSRFALQGTICLITLQSGSAGRGHRCWSWPDLPHPERTTLSATAQGYRSQDPCAGSTGWQPMSAGPSPADQWLVVMLRCPLDHQWCHGCIHYSIQFTCAWLQELTNKAMSHAAFRPAHCMLACGAMHSSALSR